jgi:serine aminopeptidase S33 family
MGLVMEQAETIEGYEAVPLALPDHACLQGSGAAVLRRCSARPGRRAVMYVHCRGDSFAPEDLVGWYTDRGFHFYAADLRRVGADERPGGDGNQAVQDLGDCFTCLDAAAAHVREVDAIDTIIVSAHGAGAVIAALWCHARRGSQPADALVLASPSWATAPSWPEWARHGTAGRSPAARPSPLLVGARRRLRRGLDIACPVLVMCPATGWNAPGGAGGLLVPRALTLRRATMRLGEHVTWLKLAGGRPGQAMPEGAGRRRVFDELGRWLSAYLSGQIRDQLL